MNKSLFLSLLVLLLFACFITETQAQNKYALRLQSGVVNLSPNVTEFVNNKVQFEDFKVGNAYNLVVQFNEMPNAVQRQAIASSGIVLSTYLPELAFMAIVPERLTLEQINALNIRAFLGLTGQQKISPDISGGNFPAWAFSEEKNTVKLTVMLYAGKDMAAAEQEIKELGGTILQKSTYFNMIDVVIKKDKVKDLTETAWSSYISAIDAPLTNNNVAGMASQRSNILRDGARGLNGEGVRIGIWDETVRNHLDFSGRLTIGENFIFPNETWHGTHVAGTMAGAGLLNPAATGAAPRANIFGYNFLDNNPGQPNGNRFVEEEVLQAIQAYNITITQNSWGPTVTTCNGANAYSAAAVRRDMLSVNFPNLMTVHAAGNNQAGCAGGFTTLGDKAMKNSLVVANITNVDAISGSSSFGPTRDGRIKPDISAVGTSVFSTAFFNSYGTISGTSMACPAVSGAVAQLTQRHRQLNGGTDPRSALIRALICNNADDINNPGPDYRTGWGRLNALTSVKALEENRYLLNTITPNATGGTTITIPAGTAEFKVMLAWNDPTASPNANPALVNNLDLQLISPTGVISTPWILNPAIPANNAVQNTGADNINNIEQISLINPVAGTYTIRIIGTNIPTGIQEYALTWTGKSAYREVVYPTSGNVIDAGTTQIVMWDKAGTVGTQTVELSLNGGMTWAALTGSPVPEAGFNLSWAVPAGTASDNALIAVNRLGAQPAISGRFSIIGIPANLAARPVCGNINLTWAAVTGATSYDVFGLTQTATSNTWTLLGNTTATAFTDTRVLEGGREYFYAVRSRTATITGNRSQAVSAVATASTTSITVFNGNDSGEGSLRDAIDRICAGGIITFNEAVQEVLLTSGALVINKNITINGGSGSRLVNVIRSTDANVIGFRIINITPNSVVNINNLVIRGGILNQIETDAAGILNNGGTLTLRNSYLFGNNASSGSGSALANGISTGSAFTSTTTMINCVVANNIASTAAAAPGATIQNGYIGSPGNLTLINCTFTNNTAEATRAAVRSREGAMTVQNTIFNVGTGTAITTVSNFGAPSTTFTSLGGNLVSENAAASAPLFNNATDLRNTNPLLVGFGLAGCSPAINTGVPAGAPISDLIGTNRIGVIDRGALEYTGDAIPLNLPSITVSSSDDAGAGSLREAIQCLGNNGIISFSPSVSEVVLTTGELLINKPLTINGGTSNITIRRSSARNTPLFRVMNITTPSVANIVNLNNLNVRNGIIPEGGTTFGAVSGGGILVGTSNTRTNNVSVTNNSAPLGGGIAVFSNLTMRASMVSNNTTVSYPSVAFEDGPGIYLNAGRLDIANVAITNNSGSGNVTYQPSGGLAATGANLLFMTNATIAGNRGATSGYGALTIYGSSGAFSKNVIYANPGIPNIVGSYITEGGNIITDNSITSSPNRTDKLNAKVFFANPSANDYSLVCYGAGINAAIGAGVPDANITTDILGRYRNPAKSDAGAYMSEGCPLVPPVVSVVGGNASATLSWSAPQEIGTFSYEIYMFSNNSPATLVGTTSNLTYTVIGLNNTETYLFYVIASNDIRRSEASNRVSIRPSIILATEDTEISGGLSVYPNPSAGNFSLYFEDKTFSKDLKLRIVSITGQEVYSTELNSGSAGTHREVVNLTNYASGIYFLSIEGEKVSLKRKLSVVR